MLENKAVQLSGHNVVTNDLREPGTGRFPRLPCRRLPRRRHCCSKGIGFYRTRSWQDKSLCILDSKVGSMPWCSGHYRLVVGYAEATFSMVGKLSLIFLFAATG